MTTMTTMTTMFEPLTFSRGPAMPNRFMLAPLTNQQSHLDGTLSDDEFTWLTKRAEGGFGATMTCAAHVQAAGIGFEGQLGSFSDAHIPGLTRLAAAIRQAGSVALAQLHHAGLRTPRALIDGADPVGPSPDEATGTRQLSTAEVEQVIDDFAAAARRAELAGFDGIELHGAHSYLLCAFLAPTTNRRDDQYGGSAENRARVLVDTIAEIRRRCGDDFIVGVRLSPERFGLVFDEMLTLAEQLMTGGEIDFLDMSLWDCFKAPVDEAYADRPLIEHFTALERGTCRLGVAGKLYSAAAIERVLAAGADFPLLGRAAILHHDFPRRMATDPGFTMLPPPATPEYLLGEGLSERFVSYMRSSFPGFVTPAD